MKKINRQYNRTVSQDCARSAPKWLTMEGTGGRVLMRRVGIHTHYIRRSKKNNKWESLPARDMFSYIQTPEESMSEEKVA
jgi:hypothetical protein